MNKSADAYRTISEVAEELDLPQHVLRFWETRFGQIKPLKRAGGRRFYRPDDVDLLKGIRHLLYKEGYTIKGVQRILKDQGVKAVISEMRDMNADLTEVDAFSMPIPPLAAPTLEPFSPTPYAPTAFEHSCYPEENNTRRAEPPPLDIPAPITPDPAVHAVLGEDYAQYEEEMVFQHPAQEKELPPSSASEHDLLADLPLPFSSAPLPPNLAPPNLAPPSFAPASKVSMFRGGIILTEKATPDLPAMDWPVVAPPPAAPPPSTPTTIAAPVTSSETPLLDLIKKREENRAILTFALQELATCRAMIEDLRYTQQAAE